MAKITGKTKSGFEYSINSELTNDYRVIKAIAKLDSKDELEGITSSINLVELLLGDNAEKLEQHVAKKDGTVPIDDMMKEIGEILSALGQDEHTKNL